MEVSQLSVNVFCVGMYLFIVSDLIFPESPLNSVWDLGSRNQPVCSH